MSSMQQFKSIEYSVRTQDVLEFYGILSQIYYEIYTNYYGYLHFIKNANDETNFAENIILSIENKNLIKKLKSVREKILEIYVSNSGFFQKKYPIKKSEIDKLNNNLEKGQYILEKIITNFDFPDFTDKNLLKKIIFDKLTLCPTITHNKYTAASSTPIGSAGGINSHFFKGSFTDKFEDKFYRYNTNAVDYYYIDVTQSVVNKFVSPFVFEIFLSYDFDRTNFVFSEPFMLNPGFLPPFEPFYFSNLNTCFFLSSKTNPITKNIIINPNFFLKMFPKKIYDDSSNIEEAYNQRLNIIKNKLKDFISNVRLGMRLVYCQIYDNDTAINTSIQQELKKLNNASTVNEYSVLNDGSLLSSYISENGADPNFGNFRINKKETFFSDLEKNIIKDKSHLLLEKDSNDKNLIIKRIPLVYVYDDPLPIDKINNDNIFDYISDSLSDKNNVLDSLKDKMMMTEEFKKIFIESVPLTSIYFSMNVFLASAIQGSLNTVLEKPGSAKINPPIDPTKEPEKIQNLLITKILNTSLENTSNSLFKDKREY